jgi:hypothetical protein
MTVLLFTILLDYLLTAVLVGIAYFAVFRPRLESSAGKKHFFFLFALFAFLGVYELPAIFSLDATITVRNPEIAGFFEIEPNSHLMELYSLDILDLVVWLAQSLIAVFAGEKICCRPPEKNGSSSNSGDAHFEQTGG